MPWPTVALADACEINVGRTPSRSRRDYWGDGEPWLSIADMNQGRHVTVTKETVTPLAVKEAVAKPVEPGTVLLSFKLSIGKVGIATRRMFTNEAIAALPVRQGVPLEPSFLAHALASMTLAQTSNRAAMGATLNKASLSQIRIPLPPLEEQRRIAAILDQADALRGKRREALALLDDLTQSIFIDMFGDAVDLPEHSLDELAKTTSGGTPSRAMQANYGGTIPWVKSGELSDGLVLSTEEHLTPAGLAGSSAKLMPVGTVLVAMYGATAGAVAVLGVEAATNQAVCSVQLGDRLESDYFVTWLRSMRSQLLASRAGGAQPNLSQGLIRSIRLPVPPLERQREFSHRITRVRRAQAVSKDSLAIMERLFTSVQARAFQGRL